MSDLTLRKFKAIFRCYNEFLKGSNSISASIARVALVFQIIRYYKNIAKSISTKTIWKTMYTSEKDWPKEESTILELYF
jgi:hypothetical protein